MNILERVIIEPFEGLYEKVLQFLPNLLASILLVIAGIILGTVLKAIFLRVFKAFNIDKHSERFGMVEILNKGGIKDPLSLLLSKAIQWIIIFVFIVISLRALNVPAVENLFERFFLYIPNVLVAALVLFLGYLLSNFLGRAALIASVNAGIKISGLIGKFVKFTVMILSSTMALEQLGIGKETVIIAFAIIFGGIVLAFAIAFGLGGRDIAKEYLENKIKGEEKKDDIKHL